MSDESRAVALSERRELAAELTVEQVVAQAEKVLALVSKAMQEGHHYGKIPGTDKPTLLKPGAEKICFMFRVAPEFKVTEKEIPGNHREYQVICELVHMGTGAVVGHGVGCCSTMETKYRYRWSHRKCPVCGAEAIIQGKAEYGGGWVCFAKKGGCGAKFKAYDEKVTGQTLGRIENPDIADTYNTVLKMAKKRALVDATLTAFAVSDSFNQDLEELSDEPPRRAEVDEERAPAAEPSGSGERKAMIDRIAAAMKSGLFAEGEVAIYRKEVANCTAEKLHELAAEVEAEVARRKARDAEENDKAASKGFDAALDAARKKVGAGEPAQPAASDRIDAAASKQPEIF